MAYILSYLYRTIENLYLEHKDPRVEDYPLVGSLLPVLAIIAAYLVFVLYLGPKWMENRKPFNLKNVMLIYNAIQVVLNVAIFLCGISSLIFRSDYSLTCQPVDHSNTQPWMQRLIQATYGYYLMKYVDLLDTVFFILRKKNSHITFLHVYHHAGMIFGVYVHMTFLAGSHSTMLGVINLVVHSVMYSYYFITSVYDIKETLWWKRHITQLQLLQFVYLIFHFGIAIANKNCKFPLIAAFFGCVQNLFMFLLFFDFYYKAYMRKPREDSIKHSQQTQWQQPKHHQQQQQQHQEEDSSYTVLLNGDRLKSS